MKRSSEYLNPSEYTKRQRTRNVFSLASFGHSLARPSSVARAGHLSEDGRWADFQAIPLELNQRASVPAIHLENDTQDDPAVWLDVPEEDTVLETEKDAHGRPPRKRKWYASTMTVFDIGQRITGTHTYGSSSLVKGP
ncbi:hypothetical protein MSAN_00393800 [Mycena sanguinolenta]|uniref:Uncharacterized protein n=1 Tax=Mycena sanguinolenta TaxID=230812 RepID=A0A8H6Z9N2_9AGAR|nr:hypothetical protein MSAN_00393800 [Mycena sanguinolenta]